MIEVLGVGGWMGGWVGAMFWARGMEIKARRRDIIVPGEAESLYDTIKNNKTFPSARNLLQPDTRQAAPNG